MSLRTSLRTAHTAFRGFSTCLPRYNPSDNQPGPSSGPSFSDLSSILSPITSAAPKPASAPSTPSSPLGGFSSAPSVVDQPRGYSPSALPPKIDPVLDLFTNMLMKSGMKGVAQTRVTNILELIRQTSNQPPVPLLHRAILLSSPSVKVLTMRKSMKSVPTPRALTERQRTRQAIAWILKAAEKGRRVTAKREERIAKEVLAILEGESEVFKWLEQRHKEAALARSNIFAR
ncbi:ribosomal protein S7 domain-containing protein [Papiliotrema laurentii]|uniref:Ribosomal protein S7 domain-containing protein n=1 Tax=Papiliotrema laurentii TaxID=5418 RepID=A0AAD9FWF5_PAPLA|nr:ribosomal protein S7 domain-containing protein [Papiliotrema laurentii]